MDVADRIGVCSWSLHPRDTGELIESLQAVGLRKVQLALEPLLNKPDDWADAPRRLRDADIQIVSGMVGMIGEDYSTRQTIRATGGMVPDKHWPANWANLQRIAQLARDAAIEVVSAHAGFIPPEANDPTYDKLIDRARQVADLFARTFGGTFLLETGQETSATLERFLKDVDRPNIGANFDPANMLLYDMGDPVASLRQVLPFVRQVHIKDARREWGAETPVGSGEVDWPAFFAVLRDGDYRGDLVIEREAGADRINDIRGAIELVKRHLENV